MRPSDPLPGQDDALTILDKVKLCSDYSLDQTRAGERSKFTVTCNHCGTVVAVLSDVVKSERLPVKLLHRCRLVKMV